MTPQQRGEYFTLLNKALEHAIPPNTTAFAEYRAQFSAEELKRLPDYNPQTQRDFDRWDLARANRILELFENRPNLPDQAAILTRYQTIKTRSKNRLGGT